MVMAMVMTMVMATVMTMTIAMVMMMVMAVATAMRIVFSLHLASCGIANKVPIRILPRDNGRTYNYPATTGAC